MEQKEKQNMSERLKKNRGGWLRELAESDVRLPMRLTNDVAFRQVFHNKIALKGLLAALLGLKKEDIMEIEYRDTAVTGEYADNHGGTMDLKINLNQEKNINIELQMEFFPFWRERSLFYLSRVFLEGFLRGESYGELEPCIHIGILNFDFRENSPFYSKIELWDRENQQLYSGKFSLRVLQLNHIEQATEMQKNSALYKWAEFFLARDWEVFEMYGNQDEAMQAAVEELERLNTDKTLRHAYLMAELKASDETTIRNYYKEKGILEGIEEGRKIGREIGIKEGIKEGETRFGKLCARLLAEDRQEALKRAAEDEAYREQLYEEYGLE